MLENNRRVSQRFKAKPGSAVNFVEGAAVVRDISMDGIFILDVDPLPVGSRVAFSISLRNEPVTYQGVVRRSVNGEGMGIQFDQTSREARRQLLAQIAAIA